MIDTFSIPLDVTIRHARRDDLRKLEWFGLLTDFRETIERAYGRAEVGEIAFLVADANHFPIGQVWVDFVKHSNEGVGVIWALRVMPTMQNLGIGSRLVLAAESCIHAHGLNIAELGVAKNNIAAQRLYERLGYNIVRDNIERWDYTTPDREIRHVAEHEWILRKDMLRKTDD